MSSLPEEKFLKKLVKIEINDTIYHTTNEIYETETKIESICTKLTKKKHSLNYKDEFK